MKPTNQSQDSNKQVYKAKLKFEMTPAGAWVAYVHQVPGTRYFKGVPSDSDKPKRVVLVDGKISCQIMPKTLYDCDLVEMARWGGGKLQGYICKKATVTQFPAALSMFYRKGKSYSLEITFGNQKVRYDPYKGKEKTLCDYDTVRDRLAKRLDIKDLDNVLYDFDNAAAYLKRLMKKDGVIGIESAIDNDER